MTAPQATPLPPGCFTDPARPQTFSFEGRTIPAIQGQSIGAALYAAGVRVFSRSFKYHRPRGLFCVSGDCPNCLMQVDGRPNVRTCIEPARRGQVVRGGPAGQEAANTAAEAGADVLLVERQPALGGHLLLAGKRYADISRLQPPPGTKIGPRRTLLNTTVFGLYEDNLLGAFQGDR